MYAAFMLRAGFSYPAEVLTYKSFCQMWHRDFPWVKTKRRKTIASKCFVCEDLEVLWGTTHVRGPWWRGGGGEERSSISIEQPQLIVQRLTFPNSTSCCLSAPGPDLDREGPQEDGHSAATPVRPSAFSAGRETSLLRAAATGPEPSGELHLPYRRWDATSNL